MIYDPEDEIYSLEKLVDELNGEIYALKQQVLDLHNEIVDLKTENERLESALQKEMWRY